MTWSMHAGGSDREGRYLDVYDEAWMVRANGEDPVAVTVTEDPEGPYYGWVDTGDERPCLIRDSEFIFGAQFTYGVEPEIRRGRGRVIRLTITPTEEEQA